MDPAAAELFGAIEMVPAAVANEIVATNAEKETDDWAPSPLVDGFSPTINQEELDCMMKRIVPPDSQNKLRGKVESRDFYTPSPRFFSVFMVWGRGTKAHFTRDSFYCQKLIAEELGFSFAELLALRGWSVTRKNTNDYNGPLNVDIVYRRLLPCLQYLPAATAKRFQSLETILEGVYKFLLSKKTCVPMAYEKDCLFGNSDGNAETTRQEIMMSTCGRSALVDIREQPLSARFRNTKEQQHLQLAFVTLKACFAMVLSKKQRDDVLFYENLFTLVFKDCSDRRMLLEGLQELLMYCPDDAAVAGQKDTLRQWLKQPRTILTLARDSSKPFGTTNEYEDNLWESVRNNFQKLSTDHRYRSLQKDRVITRLVVFMKLKKFHAPADSVTTEIDSAAIDGGSQKRKASTMNQDMLSVNEVHRPTRLNEQRFQQFAQKLREFLFAKVCYTEWVTLQLLNLSHLQGGNRHLDKLNDPRESYNRSIVFCFHFVDSLGDLWSLKVITCFRKRIGDYMTEAYSKLKAKRKSVRFSSSISRNVSGG